MDYKNDNLYIDKIVHHKDDKAFALLMQKHMAMAYNIAFRIVRNREDAQEVTQDAFVKIYNAIPGFRGDSKFSSWMYRIVYNQALSSIRKKSILSEAGTIDDHEEVHDESACDEALQLDKATRKKYIGQAISGLEETESVIITLYYMNDESAEEISIITGLSVSNVKVKLFRARKKIQVALQRMLKDELNEIL